MEKDKPASPRPIDGSRAGVLRFCSVLPLVGGALVVLSWHADLSIIIHLADNLPPIHYNASWCFVLCGAGLLFLRGGFAGRASACGAVASALGAATLFEYVTGVDLCIDHVLVDASGMAATSHVGRMSPHEAVSFAMCGLALVIADRRVRFAQRSVAIVLMGAVASAIGLVAVVGYIGGYEAGYSFGRMTHIAIHAAVMLTILGAGLSLYGWFTRVVGEVEGRHLRGAILLYASGGLVIAMLLSTTLATLPIQQQLRQRQIDQIGQVLEAKRYAIEQYRLGLEDTANRVSGRSRPRQLLAQYNNGEVTLRDYAVAARPLLRGAMRWNEHLVGLVSVSADGERAASIGKQIDRRIWPLRATSIPRVSIAGPWKVDDSFYLTVGAPIVDGHGRRMGTNILMLHWAPLRQIIVATRDAGPSTRTELVLTGVDTKVLDAAGAGRWRKSPPELGKLLRQLAQGEVGIRPPRLDDPASRLLAYSQVPNSNWAVLLSTDPASLQSQNRLRTMMIYSAVLLAALLGAWGVYLLVQPLTDGIIVHANTLERRVRQATQSMQLEIKEYKRLDAALASQAGRLDRANAALRESQERLSLALGTAQIGTWDWAVEEKTMQWDEHLHEIFGLAPGTFDGTYEAFLAAVHGEDVDRVEHAIEASLKDGVEFELDFRILLPDARTHYLSSRATVLRDEDGNPERMLGVCLDITERLRAQQKLEEHAREQDRLNTELGRSNQELQQFAYVASHDLQEPLRMVASYVQLLERRYKEKLDGDALEFIAYAVDGAKRMQTLINDLLDYSRVSTQGEELAPTDANEPLERALANLQARINDTGAQITCGPMPTINADAGQLARLFQNLIGNAMKFCADRTPKIDVSARLEGHEWIVSIQDNGIGIEPQYADRIFIIFQRLHTRTEYEGTGIGLAVCKRIVDRHGGRIWFDSVPNEGTTFHFSIPAVEGNDP